MGIPSGKAAVIVIDNQYGLFNGVVTADTADAVWKQVTAGLLERHYDKVIIVTGHHPKIKNNPIIRALQQATSRFGQVDMFTMMHTNMVREDGGTEDGVSGAIAQLPFQVWTNALTSKQRSHLRFLYSMGCDDGNELAAAESFELGFKTYVGHEGTAHNVIATYPLLARWMRGQDIQNAVNETNNEMTNCLPMVGDALEARSTEIKATLKKFLECNRAAGDDENDELLTDGSVLKGVPRDKKAVAICIDDAVSTVAPIFTKAALTAARCIPTASEAFGHIKDPVATARGLFESSGDQALRDIARDTFNDYRIRKATESVLPSQSFTETFREHAQNMRLVVYGQDIHFDDEPRSTKPLPRSEKIEKLVAMIRQNTVEKKLETKEIRLADAAIDWLCKLGARREVALIADNREIEPGARLMAATHLADLGDFRFLRRMALGAEREIASDIRLEAATCLARRGDFGALRKLAEGVDGERLLYPLYELGDTAYLKRALSSEGTLPSTRIEIADIFIKKGKFAEIEGYLSKALCREGNSPDFRLEIAKLFIRKGKFKKVEHVLRTMLDNIATPPKVRLEIVGIFVENGMFDAIKELGGLFEENIRSMNSDGISIRKIWEQAKKDPVFAENFTSEISSILSRSDLSDIYDPAQCSIVYIEMVEMSPILLIKAVTKIAERRAVDRDGDESEFMLFAVALLFDRGKISEETARELFSRAKISKDDAKQFIDDVQGERVMGFDPCSVIKKLFFF